MLYSSSEAEQKVPESSGHKNIYDYTGRVLLLKAPRPGNNFHNEQIIILTLCFLYKAPTAPNKDATWSNPNALVFINMLRNCRKHFSIAIIVGSG